MSKWAWLYKTDKDNTFDPDGDFSLGTVYDVMAREGLLRVFFYDNVPGRAEFVRMMGHPGQLVYVPYGPDRLPIAFARVTCLTGASGLMHFCYFMAGMPCRYELADDLYDFLADGGMQSLIGLTPKPYRHAIRFAVSTGFRVVGTVPGACYMASRERFVDGVLSVKDLRKEA